MRLFVATLAILAVAPPAALAADAAERPPLRARLVTCATGPTAADRYAVFTGSMPAIVGATRMEMRFDLLQRHSGTLGFARVPLPKWGQWERTERRGIAGFIFTKRVEQLAAPAVYRAVVRFRWFDAGGHLVRSQKRVSGLCRQQDPRPDLEVGTLGAAPDGRYLVEIVNDGLTDSGPFSMALGAATTQVASLSAGQRVLVPVVADRCAPGDQVSIALDTGDDVEEADELDDAVVRSCPFQ
jgi:hypothetical protein